MKDVGRSVHSVDIVKKKSSSGCLIIKRKVTDGGDSSSRQDAKRSRLMIRSDSESSDEFTDPYVKNPDRSLDLGFSNGAYVSGRELDARKKLGDGLGLGFGGPDVFLERKARKDVYDHNHNHNPNHRLNSHYSRWQDGDRMVSGSGSSSSSRRMYDRNTVLDVKNNRFERQVSDAPIRLQGKNGVLKVMVKKHKPIPVPFLDYEPAQEERKESRPVLYKKKQLNVPHKDNNHWEVSNKSKEVMRSPMYPGSKKHVFQTSNEKVVKSEKKLTPVTPLTNNVASVKGKETKVVKRGSGTEKQLLREKIRSMLLSAGWTIDYRPRRNRDYLDAVYINTSGTAYWSIIKAYEALQKEGTDHSQVGGEFTPLPVETLSKLTRQTRKKLEREMKKKRKDEGKCRDSGDDDDEDFSNDSMETVKKQNLGMDSVQGRKSNKFGRCTLFIRNEGKIIENDRFVPYSGKRTVFSWLIDSETVQIGEKVQYMNRKKTRVMQEGWITKEGVRCGCCSKILTVLKFELHAGSKLRQPFLNIFVESGKSLSECLLDAWNKQGELERKGFHDVNMDGDDSNDDTCGLCGDGGDLICCDGCPSTFHQTCLGIQMLPQGDWHCPNCSCKYCETVTEAAAKTESTLLVCHMCEKKYHKSCSSEMDDNNPPVDPTDPYLSFCGHKCLQLYNNFRKLVGVKHELDSGFSWSIIHRSDLSPTDSCSSIEISQKVECNSKLAVALSVIDECFLPIADRRSGVNLIHNVVYNCGSNFNRLNYSGFFTAVLERADEIVSAASIRIHGTQLAEMPFIGTRHVYRRQGMCRRLLSVIESALASLHVEKLIIPAIAEHMHTWTGVFGFKPLEESHKQELRSVNMLVFPGTDMLQKSLDKTSIQIKIPEPISPVDKESSGKTGPTDSDSHDSTRSVKDDACLPVLAKNVHSDSIKAKDVKLTIGKTADAGSDSKVEGFAVEICNSIPLLESDSVDAKSVEERVSENPCLLAGTESDTIVNISS